MNKSPNKHNRLYVSAEPLNPKITELIESRQIGPKDAPDERTKILVDKFEWDYLDAKRIWAFGPDDQGANLLVNVCGEVSYMNEIKDSMAAAFQWVSKEGVLAEENLRSVRMNIVDVSLHSDAIHRGGGQIIPTARRSYYAAQLTAEPRLQEPAFLARLTSPKEMSSVVRKRLDQRRCTIVEEEPGSVSFLEVLKFYLPASELIELKGDLKQIEESRIFMEYIFDHWSIIPDNPLLSDSCSGKIVKEIRKRKELKEELSLHLYFDDF